MRPPRGLTPEEADLWKRVAATVTPMRGRRAAAKPAADPAPVAAPKPPPAARPPRQGAAPPPVAPPPRPVARPISDRTLDGSWDRKLSGGVVAPDFTLDLHGHTLDSAHARLDHGLTQALAQGARVLLLITGKSRPSDDHASRGSRRGAIRAKVLDWLALGSHGSRIAAVRPAHPRHGGAGALYIVLKRAR
jgi:DNA-nicking Smr family endonuclease